MCMVGIYLDMCMCMFRKLPGHVHVHVWEVLPDDVLTVGPGHCAEPQGGASCSVDWTAGEDKS